MGHLRLNVATLSFNATGILNKQGFGEEPGRTIDLEASKSINNMSDIQHTWI